VAFIIFRIFPQLSHHNATFHLAKQLLDRGHRVLYVGNSDMRRVVIDNGFEYFTLKADIYPRLQPIRNSESAWFILKNYRKRKRFFKKISEDFFKGQAFEETIQLKPDIIIVDSPFVRHALSLLNRNIKFAIVETMVSLHKDKGRPPLDSLLQPNNSKLSSFKIEFAWQKHLFKKKLERLILGDMMPSSSLIKKFCLRNGLGADVVDMKRYLHPGINKAPELILSPKEFDFPCTQKENQFYIGPAMNSLRSSEVQDWKYKMTIDQFASVKTVGQTKSNFVIYCSFGSAPWRYNYLKQFFDKLVDILRSRANWKLIMSVGFEVDFKKFHNVPENVRIFQVVPQIEVLSRVDMMITHGGMNSINECIQAGVPMFVLPGLRYLDQVGNAARVKYHGMGLTGSLRWETKKLAEQKIESILDTPAFVSNVLRMRDEIWKNKNYEMGHVVIENILNGKIRNELLYISNTGH